MGRKAIIGVFCVFVAGGVVAAILFWQGSVNPKDLIPPKTYTAPSTCLACRKSSEMTWCPPQKPPFECPHCAQRAFFPWYFCNGCRKRFVAPAVRNEAGDPVTPEKLNCPACGSPDVTPVDLTNTEQKPAGDLPLPKWPL
ncbi:MAG: hypothetical protein U1D55_09785 [Phycisphaerae bacterium]